MTLSRKEPAMPLLRRTIPALAALAACATLSGCLSFGASVPDSLMTLSTAAAPAPAGTVLSGRMTSALIVLVPAVPQKLRTPRIPVQASDTSIAYLAKAQWVEPPSRLFQRLLSETISAGGDRVVLNESELVTGPGELLSGELVEFGVDSRTNQAIVVYQAARVQQDGSVIMQQRFEAREPVAEITPADVGPALNRAANRVAADVAAWLRS